MATRPKLPRQFAHDCLAAAMVDDTLRPRRARGLIAAGWGIVIFTASCRTVPTLPPQGQSSFSVVVPPTPPMAAGASITEEPPDRRRFVDAAPIPPLGLPTYPADALAAHAGWVIVGVRITIDEHGRVAEVRQSPVSMTTPNAYADSFWAAVETAVRQWRFYPAQYREEHRRTVDGQTVWELTGVEQTPSTSDLSFNFTATGQVLPGNGR
jgi:hypothetical protein